MANIATEAPWKTRAVVAHVAPLLVFMLLAELVSLFGVSNSELPWYRRAPEHWVYPLQCVVAGLLLLAFRRDYVLRPARGLNLAVVAATLGIAFWIAPGIAYDRLHLDGAETPGWWEWLGMVPRREGFNPTVFEPGGAAYYLTVVLRFFRMVIIVPLVEELFWRGFLMRYVQAGERPFTSVPFGTHSWKAFWITTLAVTLIHQPSDYLAAFVWGSLMYGVAVKTRSLWACAIMHAVGNLLLGLHVMNTQMWGYW